MDPRVNQEIEWTSYEVEAARSLVARLSGVNGGISGGGEVNKKHNDIVDELRAWFPLKTTRQVTDLYVDLVVEMHIQEEESRLRHAAASNGNYSSYGNGGGRPGACAMSDLVKDNFGVPEEEEEAVAVAAMDGGGNGVVLGFPLEEMRYVEMEAAAAAVVGMGGGDGVVLGFPSEEMRYVEVEEVPPVVIEKRIVDHQPVVAPRTGRFWTTEEHRQFLRGLRVYGRGAWKNISRHFVPTRTPVQVSSHAQKYFRRQEISSIGGGSSVGKQRYSINDVGLHDDDAADPWAAVAAAAENSFGTATWEALAFAGGAAVHHHDPASSFGLRAAAPGVISPAPPPLVTMDELAQLWRSPLLYSQLQVGGGGQPPAWSGQQAVMVPGAAPVEGRAGNPVPAACQQGPAACLPDADQWMNNNLE